MSSKSLDVKLGYCRLKFVGMFDSEGRDGKVLAPLNPLNKFRNLRGIHTLLLFLTEGSLTILYIYTTELGTGGVQRHVCSVRVTPEGLVGRGKFGVGVGGWSER